MNAKKCKMLRRIAKGIVAKVQDSKTEAGDLFETTYTEQQERRKIMKNAEGRLQVSIGTISVNPHCFRGTYKGLKAANR